jgi:hypothetical protein
MDKLIATRSVLAEAFISESAEADDYWYEGQSAEIQIERTDDNEVRIGTHVMGQLHESAGIYLKRDEAIRVLLALAQAIGDR